MIITIFSIHKIIDLGIVCGDLNMNPFEKELVYSEIDEKMKQTCKIE